MKTITAILWHTHANNLKRARALFPDNLKVNIYSVADIEEEKESLDEVLYEMEHSDVLFFFRSTKEAVWSELEERAENLALPFICIASDLAYWKSKNTELEVLSKCSDYITYGGIGNFASMINYIAAEVLLMDLKYSEPLLLPWEGIYHPDFDHCFQSVSQYLKEYNKNSGKPCIGIIISRGNYVNNNLESENLMIKLLEERGLRVIPMFCYSLKNEALGTKGVAAAIEKYFYNDKNELLVNGILKMISFPVSSNSEDGRGFLEKLNVPVFQPIKSYYHTVEQWENSLTGIDKEVAWSVALPEFEGVIEPLIVAAGRYEGEIEIRAAIEERCERLADKINKWVSLALKPVNERKIAFILHNNPCASLESSIGGGANLDTLASLASIMQEMEKKGYSVEAPLNGKELIDNIMDKKAISEFRWTSIEEIVNKGGALEFIDVQKYRVWFDKWSDKVKDKVVKSWGNPPGEEVNGVPAAMIYNNKIVVTGVNYGNVVVCAQPKRGCAGSRCDGQVCKILHDPDLPPTHQYLATYRYLEDIFKADAIVHVGTHGNLEFLPGKGTALSKDCYPDIALGTMPHLYIYNADNSPEGTIAKRRANAVLTDHMQTVFSSSGLYDDLLDLDRSLEEYERAKLTDPARAHILQHEIKDELKKTNLDKDIKIEEYSDFDSLTTAVHERLSLIRNTGIQEGQHIFGKIPEGEKRAQLINTIMKFETVNDSTLRNELAKSLNLDLKELLENQGEINKEQGISNGALLEQLDLMGKKVIKEIISKGKSELFNNKDFTKRILEINESIENSKEIDALLKGFKGEYIPAGPSGLITRGKAEVLPTGRNFYSFDPYTLPTKAAYKVGIRLAEEVTEKYLKEEGEYPENIAIQWMCNDIMWTDGEAMGQILYLLGARPLWNVSGRVSGYEIIPLKELGRPRIDVTIRVSGITRDNFINLVEYLDEVIKAVAELNEDPSENYIRKHSLEKLNGDKSEKAWRQATYRIFSSKPGTYGSGVNLAVQASAWKSEKDLSDIFMYWNSYAYGKDVEGVKAVKELKSSLETVSISYNKVASDEHDLLGCCCYFGTHGGMTAAAKTASGKDIKTYYGDTREPEHVEVRTLADEIRRVTRTKLLNPKWIEGQKEHGYKGAGDIMKRVGRVYGWEATTGQVDDWIFDSIASTFVSDKENREFFKENNPWALEEIARRLLEAEGRKLWKADPEILQDLQENYLEIEGWIEEGMGDSTGEIQGGAVDIYSYDEVEDWNMEMKKIKEELEGTINGK